MNLKFLHRLCFAALLPGLAAWPHPAHAADPVDPNRFEREVLVPAAHDALQMEVLPHGDIVFAEFWGPVKRWDAKSGAVTTLGQVPTYAKGEVGLLGMAVAPDFEQSGYVYALFC